MYNPIPYNMALITILKDDLHYIQRAARREKATEADFLHAIIEKHRYPGGQILQYGTKIQTASRAAGVTCPKETGEMDPNLTCQACKHFINCYAAILDVLQ